MSTWSALFATRSTFLSRNRDAMSRSSGVTPDWTSTTKRTIPASARARSIWRSTSS